MAALLASACVLASGCGDDDAPKDSASGDDGGTRPAGRGGSSSGPTAGKGGRGGSSAPAAGKGGASSNAGSTAGGGPGEFDDYWKRRSVHVTVIDPANPTGFKDETYELPDKIANPVDGRELDLYIQIKDDTRITYALFEGDQVYYRMVTPLTKSDDTYFATENGEPQIYELEDGVLKDTRVTGAATFSLTAQSTYEKAAQFPPSDWPDQMLDAPEIMP